MASGFAKEQNHIEKQMGCMTGFLHIFDRHHFITGKRLYSTKRLPPSSVGDSASESAPSSPAISGELGRPRRWSALSPQRPETEVAAPPPKSPLPLPVFEKARPPWKFSKEAPRLSLDSRATMDAKGSLHPKSVVSDTKEGGQHCRSPSVIAKLMGLEQLPNSSDSETVQTPELRRSASESRVSRDLFQSRFNSDGNSLKNAVKDNQSSDAHYTDPRNNSHRKTDNVQAFEGARGGCVNTTPWRAPQPRKSFFDSGDIFPEPKQSNTICGEIERRIKARGIDEPSKDLETLKQILEALQLKGLLHSKPPSHQNQLRHRNFVYDESPIVLMKPSRSPTNRQTGNEHDYSQSNARNQPRSVRRNHNLPAETPPSPSPRRDKSLRSPTRSGRSPIDPTRSNSPVKTKPVNIQTQRRSNESPPPENRRASQVRSPKQSTRKTGSDRAPKSKKLTPEIPEKEKITTIVITEEEYSSNSTSTDTERSKTEEFKDGRSLLERCDKLLHSIAELGAADMQPSPVSVLDSSFYKDESLTPSPVTTRRSSMGFKDDYGDLEEEMWSPVISPIRSKFFETSDDCDFLYVSDILRALHHLMQDSDVFLVLEKQQYINGNDMSQVSRLRRRLIFDTINEIVGRNGQLPPWKATAGPTLPPLDKVWSEFQRIRARDACEDLFETICRVLKKDLVGSGWADRHVEESEMVLDIERLIFKDMVCEIIGDLSSSTMIRRKLVF